MRRHQCISAHTPVRSAVTVIQWSYTHATRSARQCSHTRLLLRIELCIQLDSDDDEQQGEEEAPLSSSSESESSTTSSVNASSVDDDSEELSDLDDDADDDSEHSVDDVPAGDHFEHGDLVRAPFYQAKHYRVSARQVPFAYWPGTVIDTWESADGDQWARIL